MRPDLASIPRLGCLGLGESEAAGCSPLKGDAMDRKQRISYLPLEAMDDEMRAEMERCRREGTPRPESSAVRAHVPGCFWAFAGSRETIFRDGVCDHAIKELCRVYVSRSVTCGYCGNQRSERAPAHGLSEGP